MANAAPKIVARNFHEAHTFAREVLKLSQGTYRVVANPAALFGYGEVHLVPGWDKRPDRFAVRNKLRFTRLTVIDHSEEPAEAQDSSSNGDNMVSEGGPVFTIFSNPEQWLKETDDSLRPADSAPLFEVPDSLHQEIIDELRKVAESDDKPAEEQEVTEDVEPEPDSDDEDNGVKEDDSDNDVEITQEVAADDDPDAEPVMDEHFGSMPMSDSDHAAQDDERPLNGRRRRRCKDCGDLIHPDDVEEHAAAEAAKKAALEEKAQERLK